MELTQFELLELINEVCESIRHDAEKNSIDLVIPTMAEDFTVEADRVKLFQVLIKLLSNAIKFSERIFK